MRSYLAIAAVGSGPRAVSGSPGVAGREHHKVECGHEERGTCHQWRSRASAKRAVSRRTTLLPVQILPPTGWRGAENAWRSFRELAGASAPRRSCPLGHQRNDISGGLQPVTAVLASQSAVKTLRRLPCAVGGAHRVLVSTAGWRPSSNGEFKVSTGSTTSPRSRGGGPPYGWRYAVFNGDVIQFLRSLPERGRILIMYTIGRVRPTTPRSVSGLEDVRRKIAESRKWPDGECVAVSDRRAVCRLGCVRLPRVCRRTGGIGLKPPPAPASLPVRRGYLRQSYSDETWAAMTGRLSSVD
jgi:hypothetical protein